MDWLTNWIFELLYSLQKTICYIIDFIREIFFQLAGIKPVNIDGEQTDILTHFILSDNVKRTFFSIFLIAVILLAVFVFVAIIRSEYAHGETKRTKTQILAKAMQSFAIFLIVPFVLVSFILLTNTIMGAINQSMNPQFINGGSSTIGGQILITSGQYAYIGDAGSRTEIERMFLTGELSYFDTSVVSQYYNLRSIDFLIGLMGSIVIMVMFVMSAITFIQRIFDIVLLYIISPVSVSTIPTDDGERFKNWKNMIISKVLSAYGVIIAMNLFFIIIPQISSITFFADSFKNGIVQILFLIGGAYSVTKANLIISQLTGNQNGANETMQMYRNMVTGGNIAKGILGAGATVGGAILGGKKFVDTKKSTRSYTKGFKNSFSSPTSKTYSNKNYDIEKSYNRMPFRIATMPIGMMKDLVNGGVVGMFKNAKSRAQNVMYGDNFFNHAQDKSLFINKEQLNENNTEEHKT